MLSQRWCPLYILSDEDTMEFAKTLSGMRIRLVESLRTMSRTAADVAYTILNQKGFRPIDIPVQDGGAGPDATATGCLFLASGLPGCDPETPMAP